MSVALYRKYRSRKLSEIVGQEHITGILSRALKSGRVSHAYLFTGPRGVGKTSIARILAHEINGLDYTDESNHLDIIEIDAASNNGIDDIRDLREKVNLAPVVASKKVYIIDEVHMLSKQAFNALLKTLEEPPEHVVFILATTDVDKLPETIVSRTQRHTFRRASKDDLITNLRRIASKEKIKITDDALELIAEHADGSYRDSVSLFDQMASVAPDKQEITRALIENSLGLAPGNAIDTLMQHIAAKDFENAVKSLRELEKSGIQASLIAAQSIRYIHVQAAKTPELLELVSGLIDVAGSPMPQAKLLAVIGLFCKPNQQPKKSMATRVAAPIPELVKKATEEHPKDTPPKSEKQIAKLSKDTISAKPVAKKTNGPDVELDWPTITTAAKEKSIALASLLGKCGHIANGSVLTIYARNDFYKKKLDNPKYRHILLDVLQSVTGEEWEIDVIPGVKPSSDSKVAAVAAMMGGGEEVELDS